MLLISKIESLRSHKPLWTMCFNVSSMCLQMASKILPFSLVGNDSTSTPSL
ncbi:hypothetical protein Mapa_007038 [Marchantia paleacea]|nr:hypothetical protein Mapa_007038 [Marchantia paleacea]